MLHTTLALLRQHDACEDQYDVLVAAMDDGYGDDTAIPLLRILETNGLDDALWAFRATPPEQAADRDRIGRLLACDYAEHVLPIYEAARPGDSRVRDCLAVTRRYAVGQATETELRAAAWAAAAAAEEEARWQAAAAARAAAAAAAAATTAWAAAAWAAVAARAAAAAARAAAAAAAEEEARWQAAAAAAAWEAAAWEAAAWADRAATAREAAREWQAQRLREVLAG